ncbi:MAG: XdhC family protein [bacterium]|nr:XdhC family protein [bacterium]
MSELKKIISAFESIDFDEKKAALATVIKVEGSSYRSPGARMHITDNGRWVGSISGGCLEGDALRKSRKVMLDGIPEVVTYDTMDDDNNRLGVGLGCNGIIHVLLEPVSIENIGPFSYLNLINGQDDISAMATVFKGNSLVNTGERILINNSGEVLKKDEYSLLEDLVVNDLISAIGKRRSRTIQVSTDIGQIEVFLEVFEPPIDLLVFGGGFDAQPVSGLANQMGWSVTIIDECAAHLFPINFPTANIKACDRSEVSKNVNIKPYSAAVLMSHNLNYDYEVLTQLIDSNISYIGILGPAKRTDKLMARLEKEGFDTKKLVQNNRLHSPIGLDIGADTPEEIALSIISEIKARFAGRSGGFLKYRSGPIHNKDQRTGEVFKQVYINQRYQKQESGA